MNLTTDILSFIQTFSNSSKANLTETACSAISLGSFNNSHFNSLFFIGSSVNALVPARGNVYTFFSSSTSTTVSGLKPITSTSPIFRQYERAGVLYFLPNKKLSFSKIFFSNLIFLDKITLSYLPLLISSIPLETISL